MTDPDELIAILERCPVMRLGLSDEGHPYIVPLNFAWSKQDGALILYFHCAAEGRKLDILAKNPQVCFEADCSFELVRAVRPCGWSARYESVVGYGVATVISDVAEKNRALDTLMARYGFLGTKQYETELFGRTLAVKIEVTAITGKRHA